ncbi:MAG: fused MFS/spermidine synthase [Chthoniobacterales bacterium]
MGRTGLIAAALLAGAPLAAEDFTKEFDSVYGHIIVHRRGSIVEMFATYRGWQARESGVDLDDPARIVVPYVKHAFAAGMARPDPRQVLVIGLGGGGFNHFFNTVYPEAVLTSVEIDRQVVELAKQYMGFTEHERNMVAVRDGRSFLRRSPDRYDWIFLDAFHGSMTPPHLKTAEFYREILDKLTPGGLLVANIHDDSELFYYDLATFREVFPDVTVLKVPGTANAIVLAGTGPAGAIEGKLRSFQGSPHPRWTREIDPRAIVRSMMKLTPAELARGQVMTDDFAPADYYRMIPKTPRN